MHRIALTACALALTACASELPQPSPDQAWVDLYASAGYLLMANKLDGKRLDDGRYFQVPPGAHDLEARFQFEVPGGGSLGGMSEPVQMTCELRYRYDNFEAGKRYQIQARPLMREAQGWLYDEQRNVVAKADVMRCGTF
ncbi:PA0061/PA0062 family lipoprotein [Pseudomonas sp. S9]|uniref:PA0061/PA0062 family lipoprotein n=1 Tax=Pseudomonas sp. S9 TaxID=686578 RepID=UPI00030C89A7|nr:hypothetical protein [Pseudomonas sp. S9]